MTAYLEDTMIIFLRIFTVALEEDAGPASCYDHLTPREAAAGTSYISERVSMTRRGGGKNISCSRREPNSEYSVLTAT